MLTLTIFVLSWNINASTLGSIVEETIGPIWGGASLVGRLSGIRTQNGKTKQLLTAEKFSPNLEKSAGRAPSCKFYPGIYFTTEKNHGKPQSE